MELEYEFEQAPWEQALEKLQPGSTVGAAQMLTLLQEASEEEALEALDALEGKQITLDVADLPRLPAQGASALRLQMEQQFVKDGCKLQDLEESDPLRLYLEEIAGIPAAGDVDILARQLLEGEDVITRLVDLFIGQAIAEAGNHAGAGVLLMDLIQEASLGLWQGLLQYKGGDIGEHCLWYIRQYLAKAVLLQAKNDGVGEKLSRGIQDYRDADQKLLGELGRNPTLEEIAEQLHITQTEAAVLEKTLENIRRMDRVDAQTEQEPEDQEEADQAVEDTAYFQSRQRILELLSTLEETDAKILTLRFGLEGGLPLGPQQTGEKLGMTAQQVVAREADALSKLRGIS